MQAFLTKNIENSTLFYSHNYTFMKYAAHGQRICQFVIFFFKKSTKKTMNTKKSVHCSYFFQHYLFDFLHN